jgi:hypothetical protein
MTVSPPETKKPSTLTARRPKDDLCRILSLDGGGAKGFYTLGVLKEIEGMIGCPLYKRFDLVFGTSTRAIIAALIALGCEVDEIHELYKQHVPTVMKAKREIRRRENRCWHCHNEMGHRTADDLQGQCCTPDRDSSLSHLKTTYYKYLADLFAAKVEDVEPAIPNGEQLGAESRSVLDERALVCGRHIFGWYFPFRVAQLRDARARGGKLR